MLVNLLSNEMSEYVQPTALTKKLSLNGETKIFPIYRVKLSCLYYNDQNDRIATYISKYKSENGANAFRMLNQEAYNSVIEDFIIQSNPTSIEKTQTNIELVNQREPGVILSDGRIIDGNRRYTCLRRLAKKNPDFDNFETIILDPRMENSKKQIKMLELSIQHGEEKKVDYNPIDRLVGIYQDVVKNELLTIKEYAYSTNETEADVKRRIEQAKLLVEFLEYIHMPEQYHIARDYQVVSVLGELGPLLKKCDTVEMKEKLKEIVFNNIMMRTIGDGKKFVRNLNSMMESGFFKAYVKQQDQIASELQIALENAKPLTQTELNAFVRENEEIAEQLQLSLDKSLLKAKKRETKNRPSQIVSKSISMLKDVDMNILETLTDSEREKLKAKVEQLSGMVQTINVKASNDEIPEKKIENEPIYAVQNVETVQEKAKYKIAVRHIEEPMLICIDMNQTITNLTFNIRFQLDKILSFQNGEARYKLFFLDDSEQIVSDIQTIQIHENETASCDFTLNSKMSQNKLCYLAVQSEKDENNLIQQKIPFEIQIAFSADFDI